MANRPAWEEIDHTADWALRVRGEDLRALFENAARGMISLIGGEADPQQQAVHHTITLQAPDWEVLLVKWLSELLYLMEDEGLVFTAIDVRRVEDFSLQAEVAGIPGGRFSKYIKAVTYHNLAIHHTENGYETTMVFDV